MNLETYKKESAVIKKEMETRLYKLDREYSLSNSPIKVGDMVYADYGDSLKCDKIVIHRGSSPCCIYQGLKYTTKGAPYKTGERDSIFQSSISIPLKQGKA
jgi:hypothetical protein